MRRKIKVKKEYMRRKIQQNETKGIKEGYKRKINKEQKELRSSIIVASPKGECVDLGSYGKGSGFSA